MTIPFRIWIYVFKYKFEWKIILSKQKFNTSLCDQERQCTSQQTKICEICYIEDPTKALKRFTYTTALKTVIYLPEPFSTLGSLR